MKIIESKSVLEQIKNAKHGSQIIGDFRIIFTKDLLAGAVMNSESVLGIKQTVNTEEIIVIKDSVKEPYINCYDDGIEHNIELKNLIDIFEMQI